MSDEAWKVVTGLQDQLREARRDLAAARELLGRVFDRETQHSSTCCCVICNDVRSLLAGRALAAPPLSEPTKERSDGK